MSPISSKIFTVTFAWLHGGNLPELGERYPRWVALVLGRADVVVAPTDISVYATLARAYMPFVNGTTHAFDTSTNAYVGAAVATPGGVFAATTSP